MGQKGAGLENDDLVRSMAAMGGGIAASGGPCGALVGGIATIGRLFGKAKPEDDDDPRMWRAAAEFYGRFQSEVASEYASVNCRDIAKVDWRDPKAVEAFYSGGGGEQCSRNTGKAAKILGEVIDKYQQSAS